MGALWITPDTYFAIILLFQTKYNYILIYQDKNRLFNKFYMENNKSNSKISVGDN